MNYIGNYEGITIYENGKLIKSSYKFTKTPIKEFINKFQTAITWIKSNE